MRVLIFLVSDCRYGLPTEEIAEVVPMATLLRPPGLPVIVEGFLNLAGQGVPVVRLDRLFGKAESPIGLDTALVVLRGAAPLALMVDDVINVADLPGDAAVDMASGITLNDCAVAAWDDGRGLIQLLSAERLLLQEERTRIAGLQALLRDRLAAIAEVPGW